jgi:hypothetical protein
MSSIYEYQVGVRLLIYIYVFIVYLASRLQ